MRKVAISVSVLTLIATLLAPMQANAATAKAGAACTKLKATQTVGTKKFTCIKSGKKLVWDKGVTIPKASTTKPPVSAVKKSQEIDFPVLKDVALLDKKFSLTEAMTTGGLAVSYSASGACSYDLARNSVALNSVGKCSITASQAGDTNYLPAPSITRTFAIIKIPRSIEIQEFDIQDLAEVGGLSLPFTKEADVPDVVIASLTTDICTVDGDQVTFEAVGDCKLIFTSAGNNYYEAAPTVNRTIEIISSAGDGTEESPADLGTEVIKAGISVTVDAINEEVSDAICEADSSNEACIDEDGTGVLDAELNLRYVEVVLTIKNANSTTWVADQLMLQIEDEYFDFSSVYSVDSLEGLELEPGDVITGSFFVLLPDELDSADAFIIYGNTKEEVTFFFKAKL
jgi:hypothetical protein